MPSRFCNVLLNLTDTPLSSLSGVKIAGRGVGGGGDMGHVVLLSLSPLSETGNKPLGKKWPTFSCLCSRLLAYWICSGILSQFSFV